MTENTHSPTAKEEAKRKAFIQRIRQNVPPPIPPKTPLRKEVMDAIGSIDIDEEAVLNLRKLDRCLTTL